MDRKELDNGDKSNTIVYTIRWNAKKSQRIKRIRGVSFEELMRGNLLNICDNPAREGQQMLVFEYEGYIWVAPFVVDNEGIFLKTLYPSRKYRKIFGKR